MTPFPAGAPIPGLPPISQIGFVVRDMDAALLHYTPLFGPFACLTYVNQGYEFHGEPADCELRVAYGMSGALEIELLQPLSGRSPQQEFLDAGHEGLHHMQWRFDAIDPWIARLEAAGYRRFWYKRSAQFGVAYLAHPALPMVMELVEPLVRVRDNLPARLTS